MKTLKQQLQEKNGYPYYAVFTDETLNKVIIETVKEWLTQKRQTKETLSKECLICNEYSRIQKEFIDELLEELNQQ